MHREDIEFIRQALPSRPNPHIGRVLVTGATGYVGGHLVPVLQARGYRVRVMVRAAAPECAERWPDVDVAVADALCPDQLRTALQGVDTAYFLIHSLLLGRKDLSSAEIRVAVNFRNAARETGVRRIIYLGGLGDGSAELSAHLRSRLDVGRELMRGPVPVTVLRAAIILGAGSASYEIIHDLVRRLPVLPIPRWAKTRCQPISVRDVLAYLVGVLEHEETQGQAFDIGGPSVLSYGTMMRVLADILGKRRLFPPSPVSWIPLFAYVASLVTRVPHAITWCLIEGTVNEVVCREDRITKLIPLRLLSYKEAILQAMSREERDQIHSRWSDAYPPAHELAIRLRELGHPPGYTARHSLPTAKPADALFRSICRIGGREGWFRGNWMWRLRGMLDRVLTGVGTARGRRSPSSLRINDVIDFWRVEDLRPNEMLLLRAEMRMPGRAWLQFSVRIEGDARRMEVQAFYDTDTLIGHLYWYVFLPFHFYIFSGLIRQIERRS